MKSTAYRERINSKAVAEAWAGFLEILCRWDYFVTLTYRKPQYGLEKVQRDVEWFPYQWAGHDAEELGLAYRKNRPPPKPGMDQPSGGPPRWAGQWAKCRDRSHQTRPMCVLAIEPHKSGALHAHGLVRSPDWFPLTIAGGNRAWYGLHQSGLKIERPKSQGHVARYCGKYVVKGGEIILSENLVPVAGANCPALLGAAQAG